MPRPLKRTEPLNVALEIATGKLSKLERFNHRLIRMRIEQAIDRHPDLEDLLRPVLGELDEHEKSVVTAKSAISTAKSLVKKLFVR